MKGQEAVTIGAELVIISYANMIGALYMLYIKDYRSLSELVNPPVRRENARTAYLQLLQSLTEKKITVYVENGTHPFTGLLLEVTPARLRLMTSTPAAPQPSGNSRSGQSGRFGTETHIVLEHVTAILYSYT